MYEYGRQQKMKKQTGSATSPSPTVAGATAAAFWLSGSERRRIDPAPFLPPVYKNKNTIKKE
jgi:hypothetical protein